ncbi:hypothetical protein [Priestia koreensis]|uniref:Uncharacterized protein n=1 Tax=Priestia koreensis TaxID=284581 RepID=A0A0M0KNY7_9BACI|nr:hypothetical protein [Priestia koreensis]KOO40332.1 hypothetical protein AMD01_21520 [Priestia koreensis]
MSITKAEIFEKLSTLIEYESTDITHTIPNLVKLEYSQEDQSFQVTSLTNGSARSYYDTKSASEAIYTILTTLGENL